MAQRPRSTDLYALLGVSRSADADEIKTAYRKLAQKYHPDRNPDDAAAEARFKQVSEAYSILSDTGRRRDYDEFGDAMLNPNFDAAKARSFGGAFGAGQGSGRAQAGGFQGGAGFGGIFEELFGSPGRGGFAPRPQRGADLESKLEISFMEAATGTERRIPVTRVLEDGSKRTDTLTVKIPAGIANGARVRLARKGAQGANGGPPGDLFAKIQVAAHPVFVREGQDLSVDVPLSISEATLGADIEIPTLDGRVTLHIAPGTDGGSKLRLRGKGFPGAGKQSRGDLFVTLQIRVPKDLDESGKAKVVELSALGPDSLRDALFQKDDP